VKQRTNIEAGTAPDLIVVERQELRPHPYSLGFIPNRWRVVRAAVTHHDYLCDTERLTTFIEYMDGLPPECVR